MDKKKKTPPKKKIDFRWIIVGCAIVLVIIIALVLVLTNKPKKDDKKDKPKEEDTGIKVITDESTMEKDYGFSKEDAINAVKETYQSDNYTFTAVANDDNTYTVIVENEENGEITKWTVDPSDGSRSMDS